MNLVQMIVEAPQKPSYLIRERGKIEKTINVKKNFWNVSCKAKNVNWLTIHMQDLNIRILPEEEGKKLLQEKRKEEEKEGGYVE